MSKSLVFTIVILVAIVTVGMPVTALADIRDGLISVWPFDEGAGTTAMDAVGGNDGDIRGGAAWVTGKFGTALSFDGVGYYDDGNPDTDYVDCGSDDSLKPASAVTVSAWIKTDYYVYYGQIAGYMTDTGASESGYAILTEDVGYLGAWITGDDGDGWYLWTADVPPYPNTEWVHVALTYDGASEESILYVNANLKTISNHSGDIDYDHVGNFLIGLYDDPIGGYWWPYAGLIDDVGVWGRALTPEEIEWLYDGGIGKPIPVPLVATIPANGKTLVPLNQVLSWELIQEIDLVGYDVWFGTDANEISPNYDFTKVLSMTTDTSYPPTGLEFNTTYYWRVDVHEANDVGTIFHEGWLLDFTTAPPWPVITSDPVSQVLPAGVSAQLTVEGVNMDVFEWYKQGDPDVLLISDDVKIFGAETDTLTIADFQLDDEGVYYCVVSNDEGSDTSQEAKLMIKRLIGHWPLDGDASDASDSGIDGILVGNVDFVDGIDGSAIELTQDNVDPNLHDYIILGTADDLNIGSMDFSVSAWIRGTSFSGDAAIISNKDWDSGYNPGWVLDVSSGTNAMEWNIGDGSARADYDPAEPDLNDDIWHMLCVTHDRDGLATFYIDGEVQAQVSIAHVVGSIDAGYPTCIGTDGAEGTIWPAWFTGKIDDVRIYNYVLDPYYIADMYFTFKPGGYVCIGDEPEMDFDGNCKVDIDDFATVALAWLNCNLVPTCLQ